MDDKFDKYFKILERKKQNSQDIVQIEELGAWSFRLHDMKNSRPGSDENSGFMFFRDFCFSN